VPKPTKNHSRTGCECGHLKNCQNADEIASTGDNLNVELDSQAGEGGCNNDNCSEKKFHRDRPRKQMLDLCLRACFAAVCLHFGPHPITPGLHVKTRICLLQVGTRKVPYLRGVPRLYMNRPTASQIIASLALVLHDFFTCLLLEAINSKWYSGIPGFSTSSLNLIWSLITIGI